MIIVSGENLIDVFQTKNKINYKMLVGGAGFNTALALGRLKSSIYYLSNISKDYFGNIIFKQLKKNNIKTNLVDRSDFLTALALVNNQKKPQFSFYSTNSAFRYTYKKQVSKKYLKKINLAYFTCLSLYLEPVASQSLKLMKDLKGKSIIFVDPNIREKIILNKNNFINLFKKYMRFANIIKLSDEDLKYLSNNRNEKKTILKWIKIYDLSGVILTKGKNGATLYTKNFCINEKAKKTKIVDTVGAGDTFSAGIISYFEKKKLLNLEKINNISIKDWYTALRFANKIASINCSRAGCNPPKINLV